MSRLVIVCGLAAEAKIAAAPDVDVIAIAGRADRLHSELATLSKPDAILSFGIAGGLAPDLGAGDIRIANAIMAPDGRRLEADPAWSAQLAVTLGCPLTTFAGADAPVAATSDKRALHAATGADLVDMESHHAAAWAADKCVSFAAVRVITDSAERQLPQAAAVGMRPDGKVDLAAILVSLAKNPAQLPALIRTGLDARAAFAALLRCRQRLGPRFALLDL